MFEKFFKQYVENFKPYHATKRLVYEDGLLLIAAMRYYNLTKDSFYKDFIINYFDKWIDSDGNIQEYKLEDFNIDNVLAGNALFFAYEETKNEKYLKAIKLLYKQLIYQPRTQFGNFWHKRIYPHQVWLDGLYMGQIFYMNANRYFDNQKLADDSVEQFRRIRKYLYNNDNKLFYHAYDDTKHMQWANKETGMSPNVWSRSVGWYAMALADMLDFFDEGCQTYNFFSEELELLIEGMLPHLDSKTKMIYQLVDMPDLEGNYLETSGSAMLAYAMIKGAKKHAIDKKYFKLGEEIIKGIEKTYLKEEDGQIKLEGICRVAGLDNVRRDGSVEYYLSEAVVSNDIKGVGPYFLAHIELLKR